MNNYLKMIFIVPVCTVLLFLGGTYAYYKWNTSSGEEVTIATETGYAKVFYDAGPNVTGKKIVPVLDKSSGISKEITVRSDKEFIEEISFNLYLDINILDEGLKHESFKFEIYKDNVLIKSGDFSGEYLEQNLYVCDKNNETNHIVLIGNDKVTTTESKYMLYIWIDGNMENSINMTKQNFDFTLHADGRHAIYSKPAVHENVVPEDAVYIRNAIPGRIGEHDMTSATVYTEGMEFPDTVEVGDIYRYGDYEYVYGYVCESFYDDDYNIYFSWVTELEEGYEEPINTEGWGVRVINPSKKNYGEIIDAINNVDVINMISTFESSNIVKSPEIPSTIVSLIRTYRYCENLIEASTIPNSVRDISYTFSECTSLVTAPVISSLVTSMSGTFSGCSSLMNAPEIPKTVGELFYTFSECTSLVNAPIIPSSVYDMEGTFSACTSLVTAPEIPESVSRMYSTFSGCTSLVNAPVLPSYVFEVRFLFSGCTSLVVAPEIPRSVTDLTYTFFGCSNLKVAPVLHDMIENLTATFEGCSSLLEAPIIPEGVTNLGSTFAHCTSLVRAPIIPESVTYMYATFLGCTSLVNAPVIPEYVTNMNSTFAHCTSLVNAPEIPESVTDINSIFMNCTSLVNAPEIPIYIEEMNDAFNGCTSLTGIIKINASYIYTFNEIFTDTILPITILVPEDGITYDMFIEGKESGEIPDNITISTF